MWTFMQEQVLGMKWLSTLIGNLLTAIGFDIAGKIGGSIQFFIYDVIKIVVLLCTLIFVISYIQSYFPPERTKKILGRFHGITAYIYFSVFKTVKNASGGTSTDPTIFILFLPSFCFSSNFLFLDTSPP